MAPLPADLPLRPDRRTGSNWRPRAWAGGLGPLGEVIRRRPVRRLQPAVPL